MKKYKETCALTNINLPIMLVASHIKPWKDSNNKERMDENNGILLATHVDILFDRGFITFNEDGKILYQKKIESIIKKFDLIDKTITIPDTNKEDIKKMLEKMDKYLNWHREYFHKMTNLLINE